MLALQISPVPPEYYASSVEIVKSDDDLLTEILLRLPLRSLFRLKYVSKRWLSPVSDPQFAGRRNPSRCRPSGLFVHPFPDHCTTSELNFISFDTDNDESIDEALRLPPPLSGMEILNSCNGLVTCSTCCRNEREHSYHVYNPTTKQFVTVLPPESRVGKRIEGLYLAFDPSKSAHYRVVCVWYILNEDFQIEVYSSETRHWRTSGERFYRDYFTRFDNGVYWNGAINWIVACGKYSLYFNLDEERIGGIPMIPVRDETNHMESDYRYFGESDGHLHFVEMVFHRTIQFNVYEMKKDYSEWFVKYAVDLNGLAAEFPAMIRQNDLPPDHELYQFSILSIVRGDEEDEESFMVLHTPGKAIRYNFMDHTFMEICDVVSSVLEYPLKYEDQWFSSFQYFESMSSV